MGFEHLQGHQSPAEPPLALGSWDDALRLPAWLCHVTVVSKGRQGLGVAPWVIHWAERPHGGCWALTTCQAVFQAQGCSATEPNLPGHGSTSIPVRTPTRTPSPGWGQMVTGALKPGCWGQRPEVTEENSVSGRGEGNCRLCPRHGCAGWSWHNSRAPFTKPRGLKGGTQEDAPLPRSRSFRQVRLGGGPKKAAGPVGRGRAPGLHSREEGARGLVYV